VAVKGEDIGDTQAFHNSKACGIREGKVFVLVLKNRCASLLLVPWTYSQDNRATLANLPEEGSGVAVVKPNDEEGMGLSNHEVRGKGTPVLLA